MKGKVSGKRGCCRIRGSFTDRKGKVGRERFQVRVDVAGSEIHLHEGMKGKISGKRGVLQDQGFIYLEV